MAPVVRRGTPHAARAWLSGIDGSGSRAAWILFEGTYGGGALCSLILNDVVGITEVAGGDITKRRLEAELASLRAAQKLPWVETEPARALGLVAGRSSSIAHAGRRPRPRSGAGSHSSPRSRPPGRRPWRPPIQRSPTARSSCSGFRSWRAGSSTPRPFRATLSRCRKRVRAGSWSPIRSRPSGRRRFWRASSSANSRPMRAAAGAAASPEMAWVFEATDRTEHAAIAAAAAAAFAEGQGSLTHHPLVRALTQRSLELASEVAAGRLRAADVSRKP